MESVSRNDGQDPWLSSGLDHEGLRSHAIVVSVQKDDETKAAHGSALILEKLLHEAGWKVTRLFRKKATAVELYAELYAMKTPPKLLFVVAHGTTRTVMGYDSKPLFDGRVGGLLKEAFLVLCSCVMSNSYPNSIQLNGAAAILGYTPKLKVPLFSLLDRIKHALSGENHKKEFYDCLIFPVRSALMKEETFGSLVDNCRKNWEKYINNVKSKDRYLAISLLPNKEAVRGWGPNLKLIRL